jgi:hypothetical protein
MIAHIFRGSANSCSAFYHFAVSEGRRSVAVLKYNLSVSLHFLTVMQPLIILLTSILLLLLPGLAILAWINHQELDFAERLANCIGLSVSITAILFLLSFYFQFQISNTFLIIFYIFCGLSFVAGLIHRKARLSWSWDIPVTLTLLALVLILRFIQVDNLLLPAWVDSVHHVLITRIIAETGSIPTTLEPYLSVPFSYYFGFHGCAAIFSLISGFSPEESVLILGQVLNACVPLAVYRLAKALWNRQDKALIAALLVAFISQMPAYYVTWGRYTLLTGMLILPLSMAEYIHVLEKHTWKTNPILLIIFLSGMFLAHYFTGILFALFILFDALFLYFSGGDNRTRKLIVGIVPLMLSLVLLGPWILRAFHLSGYSLETSFTIPATLTDWSGVQNYAKYLLKLSGPLRNHFFIAFGILGILPMFREKATRSFAAWSILIVILSMPAGINLPNIRPDHLIIVMFLPITISVANLLILAWDWIRKISNEKRFLQAPACLLLIGWMIWGILETRSIINPDTVFVSQADVTAINWINTHVPADASFLINDTYWQQSMYRGVDGGFWLLPLSGRDTLPPPIVYIWGEEEEVQSIKSLSKKISELNLCNSELYEILETEKLTHIYIKDGVGSLRSKNLIPCEFLTRIYYEDGISVFLVK